MSFPGDIYLLSFVGAGTVTALAVPFWRRQCLRWGLVDEPGERKIHEGSIPLAGGLAILTGLLAPVVGLAMIIQLQLLNGGTMEKLRYGLAHRAWQLSAILGGALGMTCLGWLDDRRDLRPGPKFVGQLIIALLVAMAGIRITLFVHNLVFSYCVTILWILAVTNALNFMDNMNGLCAGLGATASFFLALTSAAHGQYLVASICFLICGALLGFLPHNFPRATVFLGDAGSHLIGFLLAVLAILPHFYTSKNPHPWAVLSPLFVLAVPLFDLGWVVMLRWQSGRPFYIGDTNHLSHRLVRSGFTPAQAVILIWLIAAAVSSVVFLWI